jgi:hypothetical protein
MPLNTNKGIEQTANRLPRLLDETACPVPFDLKADVPLAICKQNARFIVVNGGLYPANVCPFPMCRNKLPDLQKTDGFLVHWHSVSPLLWFGVSIRGIKQASHAPEQTLNGFLDTAEQ